MILDGSPDEVLVGLEDLPPLRDVLAAAGIHADKRLGQHFLLDLNICRKIVRMAGPIADGHVIEVGPGPGGLTRALLEVGANVTVIEMDPRFLPLLEDLKVASAGRLRILRGDALAVDMAPTALGVDETTPMHLVSNLPYNVGTPLLIKWLTGRFRPASMTLMFQKEVARRIVAAHGSEHYGRLAVISQALCETKIVMDLPARAFTPPPKVESAVVALTPLRDSPSDDRISALQIITQNAFGQRRKMLRSSLRYQGGADLCASAGINPDVRAETVPVSGFLALADRWIAMKGADTFGS